MVGERPPGRRGRREDDRKLGANPAQLEDDFQRQHHLADAHRVNPHPVIARQGGEPARGFRGVVPESFTETPPPVSAPDHAQEIRRQQRDQRERKDEIVEEAEQRGVEGRKSKVEGQKTMRSRRRIGKWL